MPRTFKLTWQPGQTGRAGRWRKRYKGKVYYFDGGRGKSDRHAYEKALREWEARKVEIDQQGPKAHQDAYEGAIIEWEEVLAWCNKHGDKTMASLAADQLDDLRKRLAAPKLAPLRWGDRFEDRFGLDPAIVTSIAEAAERAAGLSIGTAEDGGSKQRGELIVPRAGWSDWNTARDIWKDRLEVQRRAAASREESLHAHVEAFLEEKQQQMKAAALSVGRAYELRLHLSQFEDWLGKETAVTEIDARTVAGYRSHVLERVSSREWSRTTANHYFGTAKSFIRWLWQIEAIPTLPRNLDGRSQALKIGKTTPQVSTCTKAEIATLLAEATDRTRLYMLLMLNCGMTQKDIADLHVPEVDWEQGRITRKRSKTGHIGSVPLVSYTLWPETLRLLRKEQAPGSVGRVLLNESGAPLWTAEIGINGKYKKTDNVKNAFDRLLKKTGIKGSIKSLKKTSASLLRGNEKYASLRGLFLGHAPSSVADRHYAEAPQRLLDEAVEWLGREYGLL